MAIILRRKNLGKGSTNGIVAASSTGMSVVKSWLMPNNPPQPVDYIFRWGCTSRLPQGYASAKVINSAEAIYAVNNKANCRFKLLAAEVSAPNTWPISNMLSAASTAAGMDILMRSFTGEYIARPKSHSRGLNIKKGTIDHVIREVSNNATYEDGYISEYINKVAEYRVFVLHGRIVWIVKKIPANTYDIAWNVARGGKFVNVLRGEWKSIKHIIYLAIKSAKVMGIDFCGVDIMVDNNNKAYVLELNSAPSQTSPYRQSCVSKCFDYIVNTGIMEFPDIADSPNRTWKSFIHPALVS